MLFSKMQPSQEVMYIFKNKYGIQLKVCPKIKKVRYLFVCKHIMLSLVYFSKQSIPFASKLFFKSLLIFNYQTVDVNMYLTK